MLESFRKGQRWLTMIFVSVIGLVFVFFFGTGGGLAPTGPTGNSVIELDDTTLTTIDLARQRQTTEFQLRQQLGDAYDEVGADKVVASRAFSELLQTLLLETAAKDIGLQVTKDELRQLVQTDPGLHDEQGRFDPEAFDRFARNQFGTQRIFIQTLSRQVLAQKLINLLLSQTNVSDSEIDLLTRYETEEVRIAFVALDPTALPAGVLLEDAEVATYAGEKEDTLRALYQERLPGLAEPEKVHARHILIRAAADASDELADARRADTKALRDRIVAGESFAEVAKEASQDAGTAESGGDLGTFTRGSQDPAIDDTAFALESGGLSEVVRSPYGFHLIQVDEKIAAHTPSFDDLRESLAREALRIETALEYAETKTTEITASIESGLSLEDAARSAGLTLERPAALRRRPDGYIPGLGAASEVLSAAFTLKSGESSSQIYDADGKSVLLQVLERTEPSATEIITAREERREPLLRNKQGQMIDAWLEDYRSQLEADGRLRINAELALGS